MIKKRKRGVMLILIGIALPLVLFYFQEDGEIRLGRPIIKEVERNLTPEEIELIKREKEGVKSFAEFKMRGKEREYQKELDEFLKSKGVMLKKKEDYIKKEKWTIRTKAMLIIPYNYTVGIGLIIFFIGIGKVTFSFFPKETKSKK